MRSPLVRLVLAASIVVSLLAGAAETASAYEYGPTAVYLPWVPNGAMLGSMGPFTAAVTIQNPDSWPANLASEVYEQGSMTPILKFWDLPAYGSITVSAAELGVPFPGAGVQLTSRERARITASVKQTAPIGPHIPSPEARTSAGHQVVDGYTGLVNGENAGVLNLPIVQTNSGWNTVIRVTNVGGVSGTIAVDLRAAGETEYMSLQSNGPIAPGATATFDLLARGIAPGFVGSAVAVSSVPIVAVAERYKASTSMLIINTSKPSVHCDTMQFAPLLFENYHNWNTGLSIRNAAGVPNDVTVTFYRTDGTMHKETTLTIPANAMDFVYTPATPDGASFLGAAIIEGTWPLCAVVDEVKYTGDQPDVGHAMSYTGITFLTIEDETLALPLAQKGSPTTGHGDTTGIQLFNPGFEPINVNVKFWDQNGIVAQVVLDAIPAKQSRTVYAMGLADLPDGFQGSATINVHGGGGMVAAVSNNVNYAAQYDGSASFSLPRVVNYIY
jgi:hypothetical protein